MGLIPQISIHQNSGSSFFIKDITPDYSVDNPGGYGTPNPSISNTDKVRIELTYPNSATVNFEALYKRGDPDWEVNFRDLQNITKIGTGGCASCGDTVESVNDLFPSGCYKIKYKVLGYGTKIVERSNYTLSIIGSPTDSVWVKSNGTFLNVTIAGTWLGNNFQWSSLNTFTEYTDFEVRSGSVIKQNGTVTRQGLGVYNTVVLSDFVVLGETTKSFVLTYNEESKYHNLVYKVLDIENENCYNFFSDYCGRGQKLYELTVLKSKLDLIKGETDDCVYVSDLLKRINVLIKSIESE